MQFSADLCEILRASALQLDLSCCGALHHRAGMTEIHF
jgi:hypothetical protein